MRQTTEAVTQYLGKTNFLTKNTVLILIKNIDYCLNNYVAKLFSIKKIKRSFGKRISRNKL